MNVAVKHEYDYSDKPPSEDSVHSYLADNLKGIEKKIDFLIKNYATLLEKLVDKDILTLDDAQEMLIIYGADISYIVVSHDKS